MKPTKRHMPNLLLSDRPIAYDPIIHNDIKIRCLEEHIINYKKLKQQYSEELVESKYITNNLPAELDKDKLDLILYIKEYNLSISKLKKSKSKKRSYIETLQDNVVITFEKVSDCKTSIELSTAYINKSHLNIKTNLDNILSLDKQIYDSDLQINNIKKDNN